MERQQPWYDVPVLIAIIAGFIVYVMAMIILGLVFAATYVKRFIFGQPAPSHISEPRKLYF